MAAVGGIVPDHVPVGSAVVVDRHDADGTCDSYEQSDHERTFQRSHDDPFPQVGANDSGAWRILRQDLAFDL
jgi:hypothetical protein